MIIVVAHPASRAPRWRKILDTILHRDLKPGNILATTKSDAHESRAKLLDFGLAKLMTNADSDVTMTTEGTVLRTAAYLAPEQAEGKTLDQRSDVFSLAPCSTRCSRGPGPLEETLLRRC